MFGRMFRSGSAKAAPLAAAPPPVAPPVRAERTEQAKATQDQALINALVESRQRFKQIVEVSGDFAWETDAEGAFVFVSPGVTIGYAPAAMVGVPASHFLSETGLSSRDTPFFAREPVHDVDVWLHTASGRNACLRTSAAPIESNGGPWRGARGICRDVTEERARDGVFAALQLRESLMARIVRAAASEADPDAMLRLALAETRQAFSAVRAELRRRDEAGGFSAMASSEEAGADDAPVLAAVLSRLAETRSMVTAADGDRFYICVPTSFRGKLTGALLVERSHPEGIWSDADRTFAEEVAAQFAILIEQIDIHRQLEAMARTDEMTGLLNRRAFFADLADRVARISGGSSSGALFYVDLDNFKAVNDVHGHKRGDDALIALADLLVTKTRAGDLVARLGGDEFAMWLERTDVKAAHGRARDLLGAAEGLRIFSGTPDKPLGISVGVAVFQAGCGESIADLTSRADAAMYQIKHGTKSGYVIAEPCNSQNAQAAAPAAVADRKASA
jgi:diguanylate cyclase (GGDEF)-like protein/PAS domain S-box-containing protein